jgi:hypothetical protein
MIIKAIKEFELSSVIFIRDYLQFKFEGDTDDAILTTFTLPTLLLNGTIYNHHSIGWRDALCSLINNVVKEAMEEDEHSIKITFEDNSILEISLREEDNDGPEAAMLSFENSEEWEVWQIGKLFY